MLAVVVVAMVTFVLACSAVGLRLLWLARSGGGRAAWLCGTGFSSIAMIGFPMGVISGQGYAPAGEVNLALSALGLFGNTVGIGCFYAFTVAVFRPGVGWARGLAAAAIAGMTATSIATLAATATAPDQSSSFEVTWSFNLAFQLLCTLGFGWIAVEGLHEWSRSRRRLALGLSDPVVSNRLLMWGVFGASTTLLCLVLAGLLLSGTPSATSPLAQVSQAAFGITSSAAAMLAFFPPRSYRELLRRRGAAASH
jgi:hypothetical protein